MCDSARREAGHEGGTTTTRCPDRLCLVKGAAGPDNCLREAMMKRAIPGSLFLMFALPLLFAPSLSFSAEGAGQPTAAVAGAVQLPSTLQIGVVVKDIDRATGYYSSIFGIGPWVKMEGASETKGADGKIYKYKTKTAFARIGNAQFELFQLVEGRSPIHSDFLEKWGEGIHHFGFFVGSRERKDQMVAALVKAGMPIAQERPTNAFLDTTKDTGLYTEIIETPEKMPDPGWGPVFGKVILPTNVQVGVLVNDIDKAINFYQTVLGIGPWRKMPGDGASYAKVGGKDYAFKANPAFAMQGGVQLELFKVTEGISPVHALFSDKGRQGGHHLGFFVTPEQREWMTNELEKAGIPLFQSGVVPGRGIYHFMDTAKIGGIYVEIVSPMAPTGK